MPILSEEDLERFRTKVCTLASTMRCDFGVERCNYSHNLYWARRCPFYLRDSSILRYIPACCPDVELGPGSAVLKNTCPRGNNCSFAHSLEEMNYHPLVYKTELCKEYRLGRCKTYYCHMVHGLAEFRVPRDFVLPRKRGLQIPIYAHVTMVDNIRNIQGGSSSCGHLKERCRSTRQDQDSPRVLQQQQQQQQQSLMLVTPPPPPPTTTTTTSTSKLQQCRNGINQPRNEGTQSVCGSMSLLCGKPEMGDKFSSIRWSRDMVEGAIKKKGGAAPTAFRGFRMDDGSSSGDSQDRPYDPNKADGFRGHVRVNDRIDEVSASDGESSTPWYGKGVEAPTMPNNYNFSSFDTIFQESLKNLNIPSSETGTGDSVSKMNSMMTSDDVLSKSAKVVRNVGGWKHIPPLPRSLSLHRASDDDDDDDEEDGGSIVVAAAAGSVTTSTAIAGTAATAVDLPARKDTNANLLEYIYHTISQQCELIMDKCVHATDNRVNLSLICKEAHHLWQLIVSIQSLLYDGASGFTGEEGFKSDFEGFEGQWSSLGSFYSELLEAYECESGGKAPGSHATACSASIACSAGRGGENGH